jgi:hypothetical protein
VSQLAQGADPADISRDIDISLKRAALFSEIADEVAQKKFKSAAEIESMIQAREQAMIEEQRAAATRPGATTATAPATPAAAAPAPAAPDAAPAPAPAVPAAPATPPVAPAK